MYDELPELSWTVQNVITRCPAAAAVFARFRMACVGCAMAPFETLAEAASAYRLDPEVLQDEIRRSIRKNRLAKRRGKHGKHQCIHEPRSR